MRHAEYPNLPLVECLFKEKLEKNRVWIKKSRGVEFLDFEVTVFVQTWGSTCTAFDVCSDGSPAIGGSAITKAYTTVIREINTNVFGVFIGNEPCYLVLEATDEFYEDLQEQNMAALSDAKRRYSKPNKK